MSFPGFNSTPQKPKLPTDRSTPTPTSKKPNPSSTSKQPNTPTPTPKKPNTPSTSKQPKQPNPPFTPKQPPPPPTADPIASLLADRKRRLEANEAKQAANETTEREKIQARVKARAETQSPARTKYLAEQRQKQQEAKAEKERILRAIEHDRAERRIREETRRRGY